MVNKAVAVVVVFIDLHDGEEGVKEFHLAAGECMDWHRYPELVL